MLKKNAFLDFVLVQVAHMVKIDVERVEDTFALDVVDNVLDISNGILHCELLGVDDDLVEVCVDINSTNAFELGNQTSRIWKMDFGNLVFGKQSYIDMQNLLGFGVIKFSHELIFGHLFLPLRSGESAK